MPDTPYKLATYTAFDGSTRLAHGSLPDVAVAVKQAQQHGAQGPVLIFDDSTGRSHDIDTRGTLGEVIARLMPARGRPKLGVVAREVTLLPRHWEWLAEQPGGASVALRRLVEHARRDLTGQEEQRRTQERAFHFMSAIAADLPGFEEATRALFKQDARRFATLMSSWPPDVRSHALRLSGFNRPDSS